VAVLVSHALPLVHFNVLVGWPVLLYVICVWATDPRPEPLVLFEQGVS
jgi:hypothetical protein